MQPRKKCHALRCKHVVSVYTSKGVILNIGRSLCLCQSLDHETLTSVKGIGELYLDADGPIRKTNNSLGMLHPKPPVFRYGFSIQADSLHGPKMLVAVYVVSGWQYWTANHREPVGSPVASRRNRLGNLPLPPLDPGPALWVGCRWGESMVCVPASATTHDLNHDIAVDSAAGWCRSFPSLDRYGLLRAKAAYDWSEVRLPSSRDCRCIIIGVYAAGGDG